MFEFLINILTVFIFVSVISTSTGNEYLFKKGWYRIGHKSAKIPLANVTHIDDNLIKANDYLRISGRITKIPAGGITNLTKILTLKMIFCGTQEISAGAFQNLSNLATLALNDNEIRHIKYGVFNKLNITVLFLQRNEIETIDSTAFDDMPNLFRIKLNSNKISVWDNSWFKNTPHITELYFRRNFFTEIPSWVFKHIKGSHTYNGKTIVDTKIYLSKNKISKINPNAFQNFTEFSQLWLDRNELEEFDERIFIPVFQAGGIFLSRNKISKLPEKLFPNLKSAILTLDLVGNNNLTCVPFDVVSKVKITNLQSVRGLNC